MCIINFNRQKFFISINNANKTSDEKGIEIRNAITKYASNVAKEVTGCDDTPIYMSNKYNDVPTDDLKTSKQTISFIGNIDCGEIYMDLYGGWIDKNKLKTTCNLLLLSGD